MRSDDWHLTDDVDEFLAGAGDFLRSRPALHNTPLTETEKMRVSGTDAPAALFGRLETEGEVRAAFYRTPRGYIHVTPLPAPRMGALADRLVSVGLSPAGVVAEHATAAAFAEAWQRRTGTVPVPFWATHLYRLGALNPPLPGPEGSGRGTEPADREHVVRWCREFCVEVGEQHSIDLIDAGSWSESRFGDRHFTFWRAADGSPVSMAAGTSPVGGVIRIDPVYTPASLRGRGYAGAVTAAVSRASLAAGATDVVLYADPANATSNALYQRLGFVRLADFAGYRFPDPREEAC
ncbi:GNAT family N-acetyltransferase [Streptomyces sp. NPDC058867]|uniref:GNAT family N-acetyltransferase n=1 Tax=unclassified Streptomyces TaxID=2593676 RepID=UPI0036B3345E